MKKFIFGLMFFSISLNSFAYSVISKLECSSPNPSISLATFEIRQGNESGHGRSLLAEVIYENEESVTLFKDFVTNSSFDSLKSFVVSESGDPEINGALVNLETKDKVNFKGQIALSGAVITLNCKKAK